MPETRKGQPDYFAWEKIRETKEYADMLFNYLLLELIIMEVEAAEKIPSSKVYDHGSKNQAEVLKFFTNQGIQIDPKLIEKFEKDVWPEHEVESVHFSQTLEDVLKKSDPNFKKSKPN